MSRVVFIWPPKDVDHYLAMQGAVAEQVKPSRGEHSIIAERCNTTTAVVRRWRHNRGIPALLAQPKNLRGGGPPKGVRTGASFASITRLGPGIISQPYRNKPLMDEDQITAQYDDDTYEDDPRAVRGTL